MNECSGGKVMNDKMGVYYKSKLAIALKNVMNNKIWRKVWITLENVMNDKMERVHCEQTAGTLRKKVIDSMKFIINKSGISVGKKSCILRKGFLY